MLCQQTCNLLCDFLLIFARSEKKLEVTRQLLSQSAEFEPYSAFKRIDRNMNQIINCQDIQIFLQDNGLNYSLDAINKSFISHYDIDLDEGLVFSEFLRSILPFDNPNLRSICTQRPTYDVPKDQFLNSEIECIMSRLLENEVCAYLELEPWKQNLSNQLDFSIQNCFRMIDKDNNNYLDFENFMNFFSVNNYYPYEEEIISILRRLDRDDDGRLSLDDFHRGILPKFFSPTDIQRASFQPNEKKLTSLSNKFATPSKSAYINSGSKFQATPGTIISSPSKNKYPFEPVRKVSPGRQQYQQQQQQQSPQMQQTVNLQTSPTNFNQLKEDVRARLENLDQQIHQSQMLKSQNQSQLSGSKIYNKESPRYYNQASTYGKIYSPSGRIYSPRYNLNQSQY